jgi:hypothetical protein
VSNIYGLIVASPSRAKEFCKGGNSWSLREVRARYGMTSLKDESLKSETLGGCFVRVTSVLDPVELRTLLRIIRDESYEDFPYPPKTYGQESYCEQKLATEIPFLFGDKHSEAPWLWQVPQEIVEHLAKIKTKKEISKLAKLWRKAFDRGIAAEWYAPLVTEELLEDLQHASKEAACSRKKVFVYCST